MKIACIGAGYVGGPTMAMIAYKVCRDVGDVILVMLVWFGLVWWFWVWLFFLGDLFLVVSEVSVSHNTIQHLLTPSIS